MFASLRSDSRQQRRLQRIVPALALATAALVAVAPGRLTALAAGGAAPDAATSSAPEFLAKAYADVDALAKLVDEGSVIAGFGKKAANIVDRAVESGAAAGVGAESVEQALDAPLRALFHMQVQTLLARAVDVYDAVMTTRPNPLEASLAAKKHFLDGLRDLVRPGSNWAAEPELEDLMNRLQESYVVDSQIIDEQVKQGQGKQVTIEVIKKLQQQAAAVKREAETRGAFPWDVKWQYFVENSPVGFRGQYTQGRSVVELLLMPSPDPRLKKNLLNRIGPLNLAVAFDMLM